MAAPLILGYHAVSDAWDSALAVTAAQLRAHANYFARHEYACFTLIDAERRRAAGSLPKRSVVFTFDDGYISTLAARDVLAEFGFVGTVFVVTGVVGSDRPMSWPGISQWVGTPNQNELLSMDWNELEQLQASGWEVGSHTCSHPALPELEREQLESELVSSREILSERLGTCDSIAYPYGYYSDVVVDQTQAAGYTVGVTLSSNWPVDTPLLRPRVGLFRDDSAGVLRLKISRPVTMLRRSPIAGIFENGSQVFRKAISSKARQRGDN